MQVLVCTIRNRSTCRYLCALFGIEAHAGTRVHYLELKHMQVLVCTIRNRSTCRYLCALFGIEAHAGTCVHYLE